MFDLKGCKWKTAFLHGFLYCSYYSSLSPSFFLVVVLFVRCHHLFSSLMSTLTTANHKELHLLRWNDSSPPEFTTTEVSKLGIALSLSPVTVKHSP